MSEQRSFLRVAGGIPYRLTRRKVKNINMRVGRDGMVAVSANPRVPLSAIDAFVASHADWVAKAQLHAAQQQAELAAPPPDREQALAQFRQLCDRYYPYFQSVLGQKPQIRVRDMTTRWGVCHMDKRYITFALRLYGKPLAAQEYVVVHEFCHFLQPNHSPAFWAEVEKLLPDWRERRKLLR